MAKEKTSKKAAKSAAATKKDATAKGGAKPNQTKKLVATKKEIATSSKVAEVSATAKQSTSNVKGKKIKTAATPASTLVKWYKWLGFAYLLQGMAVLFFGRNVTVPLTLQYPSIDTLASEAAGRQIVGMANRHVGDVHLAWILAITMIVFAAIHLMVSSTYRASITASLERGVNALRWLGLGVGGGLLVTATALLSGISSIPMLVVLFSAVLGGALLTLGVETAVANNNGVKTRFAHFLCGLASLSVLLPWLVFIIGIIGVFLWNGALPAYLYSVYVCQALLVGAFMLATHFRLKRQGKWIDPLYAERGYLLLTIVTVTLLSWQIVIGALK